MLDVIFGDRTVSRLLEITFVLVMVYLVLANAKAVSEVFRTLGGVYADSVRALQAR